MPKQPRTIGRDILLRVRWLYVVFLVVAAGIVARIVWVQYGPMGDGLRARAQEVTFARFKIPAGRGDILAKDGRVLATTIPEYDIHLDFGVVADSFPRVADTLAGSLARMFGDRTKREYRDYLMNNFVDRKRYVRLGDRKVSYTEQIEMSKFPWFSAGRYRSGYIAEPSSHRFQPMSPLARATIGTMLDSAALGGVEMSYDSLLRGGAGWTMKQKISGSFWIPVPDEGNSEPVNGMDIVTTIDADLQDVAEKALRESVEKHNAYWGTAIVMDVPTGGIVAMANLGKLDDGGYGEIYNYAIRRRVEPGSTFKLASLIALLEAGGMDINDMVNCTPEEGLTATVGGYAKVRDDHRVERVTLREVFEQSSNIGFARSVWGRFGADPSRFVDFVRDSLHLAGVTGIDLPQERASDIKHPKRDRARWDGVSLQMMSYGYALEVTPLQTLMLYNAVANNGIMMRPRVVSEIRNYGRTERVIEPQEMGRIASPMTIDAARRALAGVVEAGTGRFVMADAAYTAVAKTGTAQQVREGGRGYRHWDGSLDILATFVGYFPLEKPKYSCIIAIKLHEPTNRKYYGSNVAGPVFRAVADRLYARSIELHDKSYTGSVSLPKMHIPDSMGTTVGMGLREAIYFLESNGRRVRFSGAGRVAEQTVDSTGVVNLILR